MPKLKARKVVVDNRSEVREFSGKVYREALALGDVDVDNPRAVADEAIQNAIEGAGWDDKDPGVGRAVILEDGRELLNPVPMAPPVSYSQELSVNDLVERALIKYHKQLEEDKEANETLADLLHFDDDEDLEPASPWEVIDMEDDPPPIPKGDPVVTVDPPPGVGVTVVADPPPKPVA